MYEHTCNDCGGISYSAIEPDSDERSCPHCQGLEDHIVCPGCSVAFIPEIVRNLKRENDRLDDELTQAFYRIERQKSDIELLKSRLEQSANRMEDEVYGRAR